MMEHRFDIGELDSRENKVYKELLYIFSEEVLRDFQNYISEIFEMPSALWAFDSRLTVGLKQLKPKKKHQFMPSFCVYLHECTYRKGESSYCFQQDRMGIADLLERFHANPQSTDWVLSKCHMGITRIVFPLIVKNEVVGGLSVGKFRRDGDEVLIKKKVDEFIETSFRRRILNDALAQKADIVRRELVSRIDDIKKRSQEELAAKAQQIRDFLPLLQAQYAKYQGKKVSKDSFLGGFVFLESLDYRTSDIFLGYDSLWSRVDDIFSRLVDQFSLKAARAFYTDRDDFQRLVLKAYYPKTLPEIKEFAMDSRGDLLWLIEEYEGVTLPVRDARLKWMNDYIYKISESNRAVVYGAKIFHQQTILIVFGFHEGVFLSDIEKMLLRIAINRLVKFVRNVIYQTEVDIMMVATGHKLRRTHGSIKGSLNSLSRYGYRIDETHNDTQRKIIKLARDELDCALVELDLITQNYQSFSRYQWLPANEGTEIKGAIEESDVFSLLKGIENIYRVQLATDKKHVKYDLSQRQVMLYGDKQMTRLLFWNIFDNAVKFSYKGTYIHIIASQDKRGCRIHMTNRGIGVPAEETEYVFDEFFKSSFRDKKKEEAGRGLGLFICKRCLDLVLPGGKISLNSHAASQKYGERRFEGDNFITKVTVEIPVETNLLNQLKYRKKHEIDVL